MEDLMLTIEQGSDEAESDRRVLKAGMRAAAGEVRGATIVLAYYGGLPAAAVTAAIGAVVTGTSNGATVFAAGAALAAVAASEAAAGAARLRVYLDWRAENRQFGQPTRTTPVRTLTDYRPGEIVFAKVGKRFQGEETQEVAKVVIGCAGQIAINGGSLTVDKSPEEGRWHTISGARGDGGDIVFNNEEIPVVSAVKTTWRGVFRRNLGCG